MDNVEDNPFFGLDCVAEDIPKSIPKEPQTMEVKVDEPYVSISSEM